MRSLFLKIFLWFWLATTLVALALLLSTWTTQPEPSVSPWRNVFAGAVAIYAQTAAETYEREGGTALGAYVTRVEELSQARAFFFGEGGEELSGRDAPPKARELAARAASGDGPQSETVDSTVYMARGASGLGGGRFALVVEFRRTPGPDPSKSTYALRVLAVLLTAGLVCYGLARYLTAPVIALRRTARLLASGDLTARVGRSMGGRRDELADLGRDFDFMAERLESFVAAERRLLGDISHELRSPLARLGVALGLARRRSGPEAGEALDRVQLEAERLDEMIGQLLTLKRLEFETPGDGRTPVDLTRLVREVAEDADFEAQSEDRAVRIVATEACETTGDEALLRSAIENVVRNAVRYTAPGTAVEITLESCSEDGSAFAVVGVRDHGAGVPAEALADLFRPFFRVADARDRTTGGTGLGLAITERAVKYHGGKVKATNAPDGGLVVEIRLPARARRG